MTWSLSSSLLALAACTTPAAEPTVEITQKALSGPAPVLVATAPNASTVALAWTDVVGETGYYVERSTDGGQSFTQVQTLAADATAWTDTGRSSLATYCYRVRAYDGGGSAVSNVRCVLVPKGYEAESLSRTTASASASKTTHTGASGGSLVSATVSTVGGWVELATTTPATGVYGTKLRYLATPDAGRFVVKVGGVVYGNEVDGYAASPVFRELYLGEANILAASASRKLRFELTGSNPASTGTKIQIDVITMYVAQFRHEGESSGATTSSGDGQSNGNVNGASNGKVNAATLNAIGDFVRYTIAVGAPGTYSVDLRIRKGSNRGRFAAWLDESTVIGGEVDGYAASNTLAVVPLGELTIAAGGSHTVKLRVTGKNASSSSYGITVDAIDLRLATGHGCSLFGDAIPDGTVCDDASLCTQNDVCQGGVCTGGTAEVCTASDLCHEVGVCDPATGQCSNPPKADGTSCSDGDGCTENDTCQAGSCRGGPPVVCTALDSCHDVGTCDPGTGQCTQPAKPDGTGCDDGNPCTQSDSCQAGECTGGAPMTCPALDQCHDVGTCDPGSGQCTQPAKPDGTGCNDGDACTQTDTCQAGACTGSNPVTCAALDQCHGVGTCDPGSGQCTQPAKPDGTGCSDGNGCTQTDTCQGGACTGGSPVVCQPSDPCHLVGTCDQGTGQCTSPERPGVCPAPVGTRLSVGSSRSCVLRPDGTVACWGHNPGGASPPGGTFAQVSVGQYRTFGVRDDGSLACWGSFCGTLPALAFRQVSAGSDWQCGLGLDRSALCWGPGAPVAPTGSFAQIGTGWRHACALRDDATAVCWGDDEYGQAQAPAGAFVQIAVGMFHACGLEPDGSVTCWGDNGSGQLTVPAGSSFTAIAAGARHTCALDAQHAVVCWGDDQYGQASPPSGAFSDVAAGEYHSCGARSDGAIVCWGADDYGLSSPPVGQFAQVAFSPMFGSSCWIRPGGSVMCWGSAWAGELTPPAALFTQLTMGGTHTCGLASDGTAVCWGDNSYGQSDPVEGTFLQVAASYNQTCYLRSDHTAFCKGDFYTPQLPDGQYDFIATGGDCACGRDLSGTMRCTNHVACVPLTGMADVQQVSLGRYHRCALSSSGTITCWGDGSFGQLAVPAGTYAEVSVGDYHTCGLRTDGTVACWGGAHLAITPPGGTFLHLSSGYETTCGVTSAGQQWCWGLYARQPIDGDDPAAAPCTGKTDGASCSDGNACTQTDVCMAGFCVGTQAVLCAPNPCSETTKCNPGTGQCPIRPIADGTACDDNPCTSGKTCQQGVCSGGSALPDGVPCSDGMLCTDGDVCQSGTCTGSPVACATDQCHEPGSCDPGTGVCSGQGPAKPDGTACNDGNACTGPDACQAGTCTGGPPVECEAAGSTKLSAGSAFTCAIRGDGSLACWGSNQNGEATPPSGTFKEVSAGTGWACALLSDGSPRCWGGYPSQYAPTWGNFAQIATGGYGACALASDGLAMCWGGLSSPPANLVQLAVGYDHGCGVTTAGTVECWGGNDFGQSTAPAGTFVQVVAGNYRSCGLHLDGTAECWGQDATPYPPPPMTFTRLAAAEATACGLTTAGEILCWGSGNVAQSPVPAGPFVSLTVGMDHGCAMRPDDSMACWGNSYQGVDWMGAASPPVGQAQAVSTSGLRACRRDADGHVRCWGGGPVPPAGVVVRQIAVGNARVCGILADGSGKCWCTDEYQCMVPLEPVKQVAMGGFGTDVACWIRVDGSITCQSMWQGYPPPGTFAQVAVGGDAACAVRDDGTLACWGYDSGWGVTTPPDGTFKTVAVGGGSACAIRSDGELACWGYNGYGQATPPAGQFTAVAVGGDAGCGLKPDGTLVCWGGSGYYPVVPPTGPFQQLSGSGPTFCAISTSGQEWCWGQLARQPLACAVEPDGVCVSTDPVVCAPADQCHAAGTFDPVTRRCAESLMPDGTACNDGSACTQTDNCQSGVCTGANPVACSAPPWNPCETSTCEPVTGQCVPGFLPDGATCDDGNPCTQVDTCQSGWCTPGSPGGC